jgi:hypothetical protein
LKNRKVPFLIVFNTLFNISRFLRWRWTGLGWVGTEDWRKKQSQSSQSQRLSKNSILPFFLPSFFSFSLSPQGDII